MIQPASVLIVDDTRTNRQILEMMLAPEGYRILTALTGEDALAIVARQPPDLILLDIMMPGLDGYQVAARLKADAATRNIPIIMVTSRDESEARLLGLSAGAEDFLTRPVDRAELCVRVRNLLRLKVYSDRCDKYSQQLEREVELRTAELRHERDRAQRYLDTAGLLLVALDPTGRVTAANRFACTLLGWTEGELIGRDWIDTCLAPQVRDTVRDRLRELLRGASSTAENTILTRSGEERLIEWRSTVLRDDDGAVVGTFSSGTDCTEQRRAVEALKTAKRAAEAANRAKSEFLANMSHEIRTPMNGVIGMTDLVLDTELSVEQRDNLRIVKSSADGLLTVINDILDFSRMEVGKFELDAIEFNPRDTIGDTANSVALRAHQKGLEFIVDIDAAVPQMLRGDAGRLRQVLVNLLGNAIKFTAAGEVVLRVATETVGSRTAALRFSVADTGVGIPADRQTSIFEAFTQVDGSTTRVYGGTGLGLTIASQLVALMGGRIWVESEPGHGSTFNFTATFPVVDPAPVMTIPDAARLRGLSVLVVDDNVTNRRLLEGILLGWQVMPTLAENAVEALAALRTARAAERPFSLVLTDFQMPDADGFVLTESIKKDPAIAATAVVMLTSAGQPGDAARCRAAGVVGYLTKPIRSSELRDAILLATGVRSDNQARPALVTRHTIREARQTGRILLVEDNRVNQMVARRMLERRGHTLMVANNGREALAILEDAAVPAFGCVLMDVQMPEMGGFECTALIREREQTTGHHLSIIAMTAHAMKGDHARCLAAGMDAYLSKPIQPDELFDVVERYLSPPPAGSSVATPAAPRPE